MNDWEEVNTTDDDLNDGIKSNYLIKHWRGDFSLPHSYWINATLLVGGFTFLFAMAIGSLGEIINSLRIISILSLVFWPLAICLWIWGVVGVWRSADNRVLREGPSGWATIAKIMIVIGGLSMSSQIVSSAIPQTIEFARIAFGADKLNDGSEITVTDDGTAIAILGTLGEGAAARFNQNLKLYPGVNVVILDSMGGRIFEAQKISEIIANRGLNTYVEGSCASACTLILLAGIDRAATLNARVGFHQPDFPGLDAEGRRTIIADNRSLYTRAGVTADFVERAMSTMPEDMWYPTHQEMAAAGVLNRLSLGGETRLVFSQIDSIQSLEKELLKVSVYRAINQKQPQIFKKIVTTTWNSINQGKNDDEVMTAARLELIKNIGDILSNSDDQTLQSYLVLMLDQINEAKRQGYAVCGKFVRGTLNPLAVFPKSLVTRELALMERAIMSDAPDFSNRVVVNGEDMFLKAASQLPTNQIEVFSTLLEPGNDDTKCNASLALYSEIAKLGPREQPAAMRYLFASEE